MHNASNNILITGGAGYIGNHIVEQLIKTKKKMADDIAQIYADTKKFKKILNWKPKHNNIKKILKNAINWEKNKIL